MNQHPHHFSTPNPYVNNRPYAVVTLALAMLVGLYFSISARKPFYAAVIRSVDTPFQSLGEDLVLNRFRLHLKNHYQEPAEVFIKVQAETSNSHLDGVEIIMAANPMPLLEYQNLRQPMLLRFPKSVLKDQSGKRVNVELTYKSAFKTETHVISKPITLMGEARK